MAMTRIRVGIQVVKPVVSVQVPAAGAGVQPATEQAKVKAVWQIPAAAISYVLMTLDAAVDYRGLNPVVKDVHYAIDLSSVAFTKAREEFLASADAIDHFDFGKGLTDVPATSDFKGFHLERLFEDLVDATDDLYGLADIDDEQTMFFAKSLPVDATYTSDTDSLSVGKNLFDSVPTSDVIDSRAVAKARTDTATTFDAKGFDLSRSISDAVDAGDEMNSLFSTDDGEVMLFNKTLPTDVAVAGDQLQPFNFGKRAADSASTADSKTAFVGKARADQFTTSDYRKADVSKALDDLPVTGDQLTSQLEKPLTDAASHADEADLLTGKALDSASTTADAIDYFDVGKAAQDVAVTSEGMLFSTSKKLNDVALPSEYLQYGFSTSRYDFGRLTEGPSSYFDYCDPSYFASSDYSGNGIPALAFAKARTDSARATDSTSYTMIYQRSLADSVATTDDFYGAANADDDQVMAFVKAQNDAASTSEVKSFTVGLTKADAAKFSDALGKLFGRTVVDAFITGDTKVLGTGKALADTPTTSDAISSRVTSKPLADAATKSDTAALALSRGRSDAIAVGDSSSRLAGKGLADPASTGDSGSLRMTDFCDVLYFTDVYVGTSRTF